MLPDGPVITYQEEAWSAVLPELEACWKDHWREIAQDQDKMPLDVDYASYARLEDLGGLSVVTARVDGDLAGYFISFLRPHLHYQQTLCAYVDVYYVKPGYRQGYLALRLFRAAERVLAARGVQKVFAGTKVYKDMGAIFRRLRWVETETLYTKWIGG
jgi:Acetyltransferase (GNAT) family